MLACLLYRASRATTLKNLRKWQMSRVNGVEEGPINNYYPRRDDVCDSFKCFRHVMKTLIEWQDSGVKPVQYTIDVMNLSAEDELELKRYLRETPAHAPGGLTHVMYVRLRDRAKLMGLWPEKVRISKEGTKVTVAPSQGEHRRNRVKWEFKK